MTDDSDERVEQIRAWYAANVSHVADGTVKDAIPDLLAHIDTIRLGFSAAISSAARANHAAHEAKTALDATTARLREAENTIRSLLTDDESAYRAYVRRSAARTFLKGANNG